MARCVVPLLRIIMSAIGAEPDMRRYLTHLRHQRAIFAVMHSGVRVQRCGNVRL
jgi:hypothetical protein